MRWRVGGVWLALALSSAVAHAEPAPDGIAREREQADAHYAEQQRDCAKRFVASPCLDAARAEHRATLTRLRQQQLQLNEQARREATEARRRTVEATTRAERERRAASGAEAEPASGARRTLETPKPLFPARSALPRGRGPGDAEREREKTERFEARQREVEAHRAKVLQRNAERAARGKVVAPLPSPEAASAVR